MVGEESVKLAPGGHGGIEDDLAVLATVQAVPIDTTMRCLLRIDESAPALRTILAMAAASESLSDGETRLLWRGLHILAGARDTEACQPLLRLLRRPGKELDNLLGDALTEGMSRIIASVFDGDAGALFALIVDGSVASVVRTAALNAAVFLTWKGSIAREQMANVLARFHADQPAADDRGLLWETWMIAVALLGFRELAPLVHSSFTDGRISELFVFRGEFDDLLAEAERKPDDASRFAEYDIGYIEDVADALAWSDHDAVGEDAFERDYGQWTPQEPVRNPWRHVGRNDPCPCGSGLKAKRCCLDRER